MQTWLSTITGYHFFLLFSLTVSMAPQRRPVLPRLPPHAGYHGALAQDGQPFFEGWYLRLVLPPTGGNNEDGDGGGALSSMAPSLDSFAFIYHVFDPHWPVSPRRGVGLQILLPHQHMPDGNRYNAKEVSSTIRVEDSDVYRFRAASNELHIQNLFRGGSAFGLTSRRAWGRILPNRSGNLTTSVYFDFDLRPVVGWGGGAFARQYATEGFLAAFPVFEPHYQVLMSKGYATGSVVVVESGNHNNATDNTKREYNFTDAVVYLEKNWGNSFPSMWFWIQANTDFVVEGFTQALPSNTSSTNEIEVCVTSTAARRKLPLTQQQEQVGLVALHVNGRFLPFSTCQWDVAWGHWKVRGSDYQDYTVTLTGTCGDDNDDGFPVLCPTDAGMQPIAQETFCGRLRLELFQGGELILNATTGSACLELGGLPWMEADVVDTHLKKENKATMSAWLGQSEFVEPYKSILLNQQLERVGSDVLATLNKFVRIPGL